MNNTFLDSEFEFADEDLDNIVEGEQTHSEQTSAVLSEAVRRIEQANLYQALLNHNLFSDGSAREEILEVVKNELHSFIISRLEVLLGITPESVSAALSPIALPFSDEEVSALKALAGRALASRGSSSPPEPSINPVSAKSVSVSPASVPRPVVNTVATKPVVQQAPSRQAAQRPQQARAAPAAVGGPAKRPTKRPRSNNVSQVIVERANGTREMITQDYSQAVSSAAPPLAMPSQAQQDMLNAQQAESNARGGSAANLSGLIGQVLQSAAKTK